MAANMCVISDVMLLYRRFIVISFSALSNLAICLFCTARTVEPWPREGGIAMAIAIAKVLVNRQQANDNAVQLRRNSFIKNRRHLAGSFSHEWAWLKARSLRLMAVGSSCLWPVACMLWAIGASQINVVQRVVQHKFVVNGCAAHSPDLCVCVCVCLH